MGVNSSKQQNLISDPFNQRTSTGAPRYGSYYNYNHESSGSQNDSRNGYYNNGNTNNSYVNDDDRDGDDDDDECSNAIPCFSLFCPPISSSSTSYNNSSNRHRNSGTKKRKKRRKRHDHKKKKNDIGTPLPDTPNQIRQRRAAANYGGGLYNGLEVEEKEQRKLQLQQEQYQDHNGHGAYGAYGYEVYGAHGPGTQHGGYGQGHNGSGSLWSNKVVSYKDKKLHGVGLERVELG